MSKDTVSLTMTLQDLADLRHLVSIAVWIRSEQIENEEVHLLMVKPEDLSSLLPPVTVQNDMLNVRRATGDMNAARIAWGRMNTLLKQRHAEALTPSWHTPEDLDDNRTVHLSAPQCEAMSTLGRCVKDKGHGGYHRNERHGAWR
jgi:hypothetical protein